MRAPRFGHRPALDGVRGLAVAAVLCFHGGFRWARGGFLGVSLFFTLSGFLITTLALEEHDRSGRVALGAFWARRARRLLPAMALAVALAVALATVAGDASVRTALRGDVLSGFGYFANWHFLWEHNSYAALFRTPSPLLHLWSLAVEEQFYLLFPLVAVLTLRVGHWLLGAVAALWVTVGALGPMVLHFGVDRAYYGTDVRGAEIALGVCMAIVAYRFVLTPTRPVVRVVGAAGVAALAASVAAWAAIAQSDGLLRRGGFVLYALASSVLVLAAAMDAGPVAWLCRTAALRRLGLVSYGLYLFHWPVLWFLGQETDWPPWARWAVGITVSYAIAEASLRFVEMPIRRAGRERGTPATRRARRRSVPAFRWVAAAALCLLAMGFAVVGASVVNDHTTPPTDFESAQASFNRIGTASTPAVAGTAPVRSVAFFGDSTAIMTGLGFGDAVQLPDSPFVVVRGAGRLGCGIVVANQRRLGAQPNVPPAECADWSAQWAAAIDEGTPELAVVELGPWETMDNYVPELGGWTHLGDPRFDAYVLEQLRRAATILGARGARVVFLTPPNLDRVDGRAQCACSERIGILANLERQLAVEQPGRVSVVDLARWHTAHASDDERLRPDGAHVTATTGVEVAQRFLIPALSVVPPVVVDAAAR